ncbi:hypothetical protein IDM40_08530 [Nocardiopsis sp. HNM0947]|uniref:Integral membrane protein n=1 Tax=Nocardiopsis coralli TaxID=2772213 RepID=A0ABR9P4H5_9ACTN|nr:hypothetical protein [Nocardiopsis coralli]MBE2998746.1 hypothetical protein [Nocardiopsis coralli]
MRTMPDHSVPPGPRLPSSPTAPAPLADDPPAQEAAAPGADRVELRVHGVSGGRAEELLDVEPAVRVGGDRSAGFFRWRREPDTETVPGMRREIFAWGNLTSGSASRAFWLLLLPFMLLNISYWMRPGRVDRGPRGVRRVANNVYGAGVRLLALSLTVLIVLAAAGIGMDLVAWQCPAQAQECVRARPWLAFLAAPASPLSAPGTALLIGALLPALVVVALWRLSRRTASDYEVADGRVRAEPSDAAPLSKPGFWNNSETMARLRSAHIAVAVGTVAALLLVPAVGYDLEAHALGEPALPGSWVPGVLLAVLLAAVTTAATVSVLVPGVDPRWNARADLLCRVLRDLALGLAAVVALYTFWPRPGWVAEGRLPGATSMLNTLFTVQGVLVFVLVGAALALHTVDRAHGFTAMRGMAGPATAALGVLLGGAFSAALVFQGSVWLSGCGSFATEEADCVPLVPPEIYSWLQLAIALEAVVVLVVAAFLLVRLHAVRRALIPDVAEHYGRGEDARRTRDIAHAWAVGRLTDTMPGVVLALLLPVLALVGLAVHAALTGGMETGPAPAASAVAGGMEGVALETISTLTGIGSLLGAGALVALVWIGRSAYRDRPTRQAVGALWDVGTFWPRVAHPLAPPSYAERAVPQLTVRVAHLTGDGTTVVLSGHSQGSVLAAATVWQLPKDCLGRVSLVTHGSPLDRLYARYFPAYFGPHSFADLQRRTSGWRNLWRRSDAIAGPVRVRTDPDDRNSELTVVEPREPLTDPVAYDAPPGEARRPEILGHSSYTYDPAYAEALWRVSTEEAQVTGEEGPVSLEGGGDPHQGP